MNCHQKSAVMSDEAGHEPRAIHRTWLGCWSPERGLPMLTEWRLFMSPMPFWIAGATLQRRDGGVHPATVGVRP
jgi:hypothetical protein